MAYIGLLVALIVCIHSGALVVAETSYVPQWETRLEFATSVGSYYVDDVRGAASFDGILYVSGNYLNQTSNHMGTVVISVNGASGSTVKHYYFYSDSYDVISNSLIVNSNYVYTVGRLGYSASIFALDTNLDSVINFNYFSIEQHVSSYEDVCLDGNGNVYAVGVDWDYSKNPPRSYMLVSSYTPSLNRRFDQTYSGAYNLTGTGCVIGPDGYLYVVAIDKEYVASYNMYFPVYLVIVKISPSDGSLVDSNYIPLYNTNYQVSFYTDVPADIDSTGSELLVAFTYSDDQPPGSSSAGASIVGLDQSLDILWRYNVSTSNHERFTTIVAGSDGSFAVGGSTNNTYGTGLSGNVFNGIVLIFNSGRELVKAILSGDTEGSYDTIVNKVITNESGYIYWIGYAGNDEVDTGYYDVTNSVDVVKSTAGIGDARELIKGAVKLLDIKAPRLVEASTYTRTGISHRILYDLHGNKATLAVPKRTPGLLSTPSGESNGAVVSTDEQIGTPSPPPSPVPEMGILIATGELIVLLYFLSRIYSQR